MTTFRRQQPQRSGFTYHRRSATDVEKRANQGSGSFESYIRDDIALYKVKEGTNILRIMPPPSQDYEHFGIDIFTHFGIGVEKSTFLCLNKMKDEPCPVCEEHTSLRATLGGRQQLTQEEKDMLRPFNAGKRVLMYVVDRSEEDKGPQAWPAPWTLDRDIGSVMQDKLSGEILWIDDPQDGYDVSFDRKGTGLSTEYTGVQIARASSPLHRDVGKAMAWCDFTDKNSLRDILVFRDYDRIHRALHQTTATGSTQQTDGDLSNVPSDAEIERMSSDELLELADEMDIDVSDVDDEELVDYLIAEMEEIR